MPESPEEILAAYLANRSLDNRNRLVEAHLPLAARLARMAARKLDRLGSPDECYSHACLGLIEAAEKYDPSLGDWIACATYRVRMAIIDAVRNSRGRTGTDRAEFNNSTVPLLDSDMGREPTDWLEWEDELRGLFATDRMIVREASRGVAPEEIARQLKLRLPDVMRVLVRFTFKE